MTHFGNVFLDPLEYSWEAAYFCKIFDKPLESHPLWAKPPQAFTCVLGCNYDSYYNFSHPCDVDNTSFHTHVICHVLLWVICDLSCIIVSHLWRVMYYGESLVTCHVLLLVLCDFVMYDGEYFVTLSCIMVSHLWLVKYYCESFVICHVWLWLFMYYDFRITVHDNQVCMAKYITVVYCCD